MQRIISRVIWSTWVNIHQLYVWFWKRFCSLVMDFKLALQLIRGISHKAYLKVDAIDHALYHIRLLLIMALAAFFPHSRERYLTSDLSSSLRPSAQGKTRALAVLPMSDANTDHSNSNKATGSPGACILKPCCPQPSDGHSIFQYEQKAFLYPSCPLHWCFMRLSMSSFKFPVENAPWFENLLVHTIAYIYRILEMCLAPSLIK